MYLFIELCCTFHSMFSILSWTSSKGCLHIYTLLIILIWLSVVLGATVVVVVLIGAVDLCFEVSSFYFRISIKMFILAYIMCLKSRVCIVTEVFLVWDILLIRSKI